MSAAASRPAAWHQRTERGSPALLRFMRWASLALGRGASRPLVRLIAAYFLVSEGDARRAVREFLARALGREPTLAELYHQFFMFSATIHDRVYLLTGRFELFEIEVHGLDLFGPEGMLLMGAHLGSFEALRCCGRHLGQRRVTMAMHEGNRRLRSVLASLDPALLADVVTLGRPQAMIDLAERLDEGSIVGLLADRTLAGEPAALIDFLGTPAPFPTGPMRLAAALRRRVVFMTGLYRGGNRYEIRFEPLADFSTLQGLTRAERERLVADATLAYARCLERHAREAPDNWFNFHDFWGRGE